MTLLSELLLLHKTFSKNIQFSIDFLFAGLEKLSLLWRKDIEIGLGKSGEVYLFAQI